MDVRDSDAARLGVGVVVLGRSLVLGLHMVDDSGRVPMAMTTFCR